MRTTKSPLALVFTALLAASASAQDADALNKARALERDLMQVIDRTSQCYVIVGGGSGIVVSPDGDILTNHHVAGDRKVGETWTVMRPGGVFATAKVIGHDERGDISLLKLEGKGPFPYVELADSDAVQVGDAVVALGNPFGFSKDASPHVTVGVVSATHRFQQGYSDAIMTDVAINPGNSGGPLLDLQGRLIGINGRIAVRFGARANTGVGYAIPTNQIKDFIPQFRAKGVVLHGQVAGLVLAETPDPKGGARIDRVSPTSEAAESGLKAGDVVVEADGRAVGSSARFHGIVGTIPAGDKLPLVVRRGDETLKFEVTLTSRRDDRPQAAIPTKGAFLGVRVQTNAANDGVEVGEVVTGSPAEGAGVLQGDVIIAITMKGVANPTPNAAAFATIMAGFDPDTEIQLSVRRGTTTVELPVKLGKAPAAR
jgi:S1-C subfamily serine protease